MQVCYLINQLAPGGAPTLLQTIVAGMDNLDINFTVCMLGGDESLISDFEALGARAVSFHAQFKFDPRAVARLTRFIKQRDIDVLHSHLPYAQTLGRTCSLGSDVDAVVSTQHNVPDNYHPVTRLTERVTRPVDDATVAVSQGVEQAFRNDSHLFDGSLDDGWCTIHNGIDVEKFYKAVAAADTTDIDAPVAFDDLVFLNVSRYVPAKAQGNLIEAMAIVSAEVPDAKLLIVGWGPREGELRKLVADHGLGDVVTVTGRVPSVHEYYALADVFVSSSIQEGLPTTHLEAMAAELPVVATAIPGVDEAVLDEETGLLVPPQKPGTLAAAMLMMVRDGKRAQYAKAGHKHVTDRFSKAVTVENHRRLYRLLENE
jgi:glycosyltransferase involved in cell wall biosynthesis